MAKSVRGEDKKGFNQTPRRRTDRWKPGLRHWYFEGKGSEASICLEDREAQQAGPRAWGLKKVRQS